MTAKNKKQDFVGFYYLQKPEICDQLIDYFELSENKHQGSVMPLNGVTDVVYKESTDLTVSTVDAKVIGDYLTALGNCINSYIQDFFYCNFYSPFGLQESFNIQKYEPNQGYYAWHTERGSAQPPYCNRHLVFMTYLNDVTDAGETEFYHQKLKVQPQKGLTLIWPADWTHTHRGIPSTTQVKYITTGWLNFLE